MENGNIAGQPWRVQQAFNKRRERLKHFLLIKEEKYGNVIYGLVAISVLALFALAVYLLKGMVQFI